MVRKQHIVWIVALITGAAGWSLVALSHWQHRQSQERWVEAQQRLEDDLAAYARDRDRLRATNTDLKEEIARLEGRHDRLTEANGELASVREQLVLANSRLTDMETRRRVTEAAVAALVLQHEAVRSRLDASRTPPINRGPRRSSQQSVVVDTGAVTSAPNLARISQGLYAFADLKVPDAGAQDGPTLGSAAHDKAGDDRSNKATASSIKAAFNRAGVRLDRQRTADWAEAQFELGRTLAVIAQSRSGTRELKDAVLAFRAAAGQWSRKDAPIKWATVQRELGRTLAVLGRRLNDPTVRQAAIAALGKALATFDDVGASSLSAETRHLLDQINETTGDQSDKP
ncbi:MAG: hypothetical protein ACR2QH_07455 [Geminicoccaceae bacterium]